MIWQPLRALNLQRILGRLATVKGTHTWQEIQFVGRFFIFRLFSMSLYDWI